MHAWYIYSWRTPVLFMQAECVSTIVAEAMYFIVHKASKRVQSTAKSQTSCSASSFFETVQSICLVTATLQKHEVCTCMYARVIPSEARL